MPIFSGVSVGGSGGPSAPPSTMTPDQLIALGESTALVSTIGLMNDFDALVTPKVIWPGPTNDYTFLSDDTTLYLSSTDPTDTSLMSVGGIVKNTDEFRQENITPTSLNGQNQVPLPTDIFRVTGMTQLAGDALGTVYLAEADAAPGGVPAASKVKALLVQVPHPRGQKLQGGLSMGALSIPGVTVSGQVVRDCIVEFIEIHASDGFRFYVEIRLPQFPGASDLPFPFARSDTGTIQPIDFVKSPFTVPPKSDIVIYASMKSPNEEMNAIVHLKYRI